MNRLIFSGFLLIIVCPKLANAETVQLNNGTSVTGQIIKRGEDQVTLKMDADITVTYYEDEIESIDGQPFNPPKSSPAEKLSLNVPQPDSALLREALPSEMISPPEVLATESVPAPEENIDHSSVNEPEIQKHSLPAPALSVHYENPDYHLSFDLTPGWTIYDKSNNAETFYDSIFSVSEYGSLIAKFDMLHPPEKSKFIYLFTKYLREEQRGLTDQELLEFMNVYFNNILSTSNSYQVLLNPEILTLGQRSVGRFDIWNQGQGQDSFKTALYFIQADTHIFIIQMMTTPEEFDVFESLADQMVSRIKVQGDQFVIGMDEFPQIIRPTGLPSWSWMMFIPFLGFLGLKLMHKEEKESLKFSPELEVQRGISLPCSCGKEYQLKTMFAGWDVQCPSCNSVMKVQGEMITKSSANEPRFNSQIFKWPRWNRICSVRNDQGQEIGMFKISNHGANTVKLLSSIFLSVVFFIVGIVIMVMIDPQMNFLWISLPVVLFGIVVMLFMLDRKNPNPQRRQWNFYNTQDVKAPFFAVGFAKKHSLTKLEYNVIDAEGNKIALIEEYLLDFLRNIWSVKDNNRQILFTVKEESMILALIRRIPVLSWITFIPIDYVIYTGQSERVLGEIIGAFHQTKLDLSEDYDREIDQRLALAVSQIIMRRA